MVACHQRHPPRLPAVSDLGECPHHDMEVGGGLPTPTIVRLAGPPPCLDEEAAADLEAGAPLALKDAGPAYAAEGSLGYADDTQAMALGGASLQGTAPTTDEWLRIMGQDVRVDKSCSKVQGERGDLAFLLRRVPIPLADTFHQLGVDVAIGGSQVTRPVMSRRLEAGRSALRRLPHLATYNRRERAIGTLVTPLALHGVAATSVTVSDGCRRPWS